LDEKKDAYTMAADILRRNPAYLLFLLKFSISYHFLLNIPIFETGGGSSNNGAAAECMTPSAAAHKRMPAGQTERSALRVF
jgi:hypothetical protein